MLDDEKAKALVTESAVRRLYGLFKSAYFLLFITTTAIVFSAELIEVGARLEVSTPAPTQIPTTAPAVPIPAQNDWYHKFLQANSIVEKTKFTLEAVRASENKSTPPEVSQAVLDSLLQIKQYEAATSPQHASISIFSTEAFAASPSSAIDDDNSLDSVRPRIVELVIAAITLFFFIQVGLFCFTKDPEKLKFADSMMKTIVGFYTGLVTALFGLKG